MPDESDKAPLTRFIRHFLEHDVEFLVIGGQAEVIFGSPRLTLDVDLCYRRTKENLEKLVEALQPLNVHNRNAPVDLPFQLDVRSLSLGCNYTFATDWGDLDLLGFVEPIGDFEAVAANAETWEVDGVTTRTISLDDLIRVKEHICRGKDVESLYQLRAIKQVRQEQEKERNENG